jgi:hypothetical protein
MLAVLASMSQLVQIAAAQPETADASTLLTVDNASGTYGGTTNLVAHLTSGGVPVAGELVNF